MRTRPGNFNVPQNAKHDRGTNHRILFPDKDKTIHEEFRKIVLKAAQKIPVESPVRDPLETGSGKRILLAEDVKINQLVAVHLLRQMGCRVDIVNNGAEAVAAWQRNFYSAILMDFRMPEMDGSEATRMIRALESEENLPPTPIIALTANSLEGDRAVCLAAGMNDFVTKPIKRDILQAALEKAGALD